MNIIIKSANGWPKRYKMMALLVLALLLCYIDRILISIAVIDMQKEFGWSDSDKGLILSSFFIGYLVMQVLGGLLANKFGGRNIFLIAVVLWSVFTVLTPLAAYLSFTMLIIARFMLGFGEGAAFPASYNLVHKWMPSHERSRAVSSFSMASSLGTVFALLVTGAIIERYGWASVFYLFGSMGIFWAIMWVWSIPSIAEPPEELDKNKENTVDITNDHKAIPWKVLFTHPAIITLYLLTICFSGISYTLASWLPSYFVDTFNVPLSLAGLYAVLPWALLGITSILAGVYADKQVAKGIGTLKLRKQMIATGLIIVCASMLMLTVINSLVLAIVLIGAVFIGLAIMVPGYVPIPGELLPNHGDILYGFMAGVGSIASTIIVAGTGFILEATGSYDMLWISMAVTAVLAIVVFQLFAQTSPIVINQMQCTERTECF